MDISAPAFTVACPTCATPILGWAGPGPACPNCGLPAAGHAGYVVARIDSTLREFRADREGLLQSMAAFARPAASVAGQMYPTLAAQASPTPAARTVPSEPPPAPMPPMPVAAAPKAPRRLSPQQMLLGTGAVLLVSAAIAFAAVAWDSLNVAVQAGILLLLTGIVCAASASAARRGLARPGKPSPWPDSR